MTVGIPGRRPRAAAALCLPLLLAGTAVPARAQTVDTTLVVRTIADFAAACDDFGRALWSDSLCGPLVFVHAPTRAAIASAPDPERRFAADGATWFGVLPDGMPLANTAVDWAGERWTMVLLPLPADDFARLSLVAHEAFHRIQPALGLATRDAANPHLDELDGRLWLRMELRALAAALGAATDADALRATHDALAFRHHRHRLYPGADTLEAMLERHEGLAEYTGVRYAMMMLADDAAASVSAAMARFERRPSYVRALGYGTGPALGLLLDRYHPGWHRRAGEESLAALLARSVAFDAAAAVEPDADITARARGYGHAEVLQEEETRALESAARLADIRARTLEGPTLVLRQAELRASFNPNEVFPVPDAGTYYPTGTFEAAWGRLEVNAGGALVAGDWQTLRVPAAELRIDAGGRTAHGAGWRLQLADAWTLLRAGDDWIAAPGK